MQEINKKLRRVVTLLLLTLSVISLGISFFATSQPTQAAQNPLQIGWWSSMGATTSQNALDAQNAAGESTVIAYYAPGSDEFLTKAQSLNIKVYLEINPS